jgi:peptidoglycan/LPS O-acetylase OafA/YrhL
VPNAQQVENLRALTSLRFVAAFMIIVHHAPNLVHWGWPKLFPPTMFNGVSFFFVLSGFILTHVYRSKPLPSYGAFMRARFARLWPVHIAGIILLVLLVAPGSITFDGPGIFNKWIVLGFNLALLHSVFPFLAYTFSWNAVSWSISTEMFFYLVFPFLLVNIERTWHWKLLGAACLAAATLLFWWSVGAPIDGDISQVTGSYGGYPSPFMRGLEFSTGMAVWVLWNRFLRPLRLPRLAWSVLELLALGLCLLWLTKGYFLLIPYLSEWAKIWYGPASSFWVFAILIGVFASGRGVVGRALSVRPLVFLGEISFSVYMLHQLLMKSFVTTFAWPDVPELVYFPVLLALATVSYLMVEKPGQRLLLGRRDLKVTPAAA